MRQLTDPAALRNLFAVHKISQRQAAAACNVSPATINILLRKGLPPKTDWTGLKNALISLLEESGANGLDAEWALRDEETDVKEKNGESSQEENDMIIRKQHLKMSTRQHFKLLRDPFADPQGVEDVYLNPDSRFVRETMHDAAVNGNFHLVKFHLLIGNDTRADFCGNCRVPHPLEKRGIFLNTQLIDDFTNSSTLGGDF